MASDVNDTEKNYNFLYPVSKHDFHQLCDVLLLQHPETILNTKQVVQCCKVQSNMTFKQYIYLITVTEICRDKIIILHGNINIIRRRHNYSASEHKI